MTEKCPVKVWPRTGSGMKPHQCTRAANGRRGLCVQHEKILNKYRDLPLIDGGRIYDSGRRTPEKVTP